MDYGPVRPHDTSFLETPQNSLILITLLANIQTAFDYLYQFTFCSALLLDDSETSAQGPGGGPPHRTIF